jgi:hypothetical protein
MVLTLQIAFGLWLGVVSLILTFVVGSKLSEKIERSHRRGSSWWKDLVR